MSAPPARLSLFPVGPLLGALFKTYLGEFFDYTLSLLGADGTPAAARNALQVPVPNVLHNPDGAVYQRAIAATADDGYIDDRWYILTQTASATPSQVSNPEDGYAKALRLTQSQASAQRIGRAQIVEASDTYALRGKTVIFGGRLKLSTNATVRYAILAWTGTADAVTSDVVNDWTNAAFSTGNFFNSTTLSLVATNSTALTAATAATCSVSGVIPSSATNIIVLYWTEAAAAQNVTLDAWGMRLVEATALVGYIQRSYAQELALCQRFFLTFDDGSLRVGLYQAAAQGVLASALYPVPMRASPSVVVQPASWNAVNATSVTLSVGGPQHYRVSGIATALGAVSWENSGTKASMSADL